MEKGREETLAKKSSYHEVKTTDMLARIDRVTVMEKYMNSVQETLLSLSAALDSFRTVQDTVRCLSHYYESEDWREDFEADEAGRFPAGFPRGVLSEDGIYNLLEKNEELWERIKDFAKKAPKNKNTALPENSTDDKKEP